MINLYPYAYILIPIAPHIGHLYTAVISDCVVRYEKLRQRHTGYLFSTGTDEHGLKIQQAAQAREQCLQEYCTDVSNKYRDLFQKSNVNYTHFNRTSDKHRHLPAVQHFWVRYKSYIIPPEINNKHDVLECIIR